MRSRILVTAFLVFALAGASTLLARGIADSCATAGGCGDHAACCPADAGSGGKGCCEAGGCASGGCASGCCRKDASDKQWSLVNFMRTVRVGKAFVSGPVLIVHDDAKMARGEPCTTFYRFDPASGPREALVSFHCKPRRAAAVETTTFTSVSVDGGLEQLTEFQIAGDTEAHGIPR